MCALSPSHNYIAEFIYVGPETSDFWGLVKYVFEFLISNYESMNDSLYQCYCQP